jgi:hypothetical protein
MKNNSNNIYHITLFRRTRVYPPSHSNIGFYRHVSEATPNVRTLKAEEQNRAFVLVSETRITALTQNYWLMLLFLHLILLQKYGK